MRGEGRRPGRAAPRLPHQPAAALPAGEVRASPSSPCSRLRRCAWLRAAPVLTCPPPRAAACRGCRLRGKVACPVPPGKGSHGSVPREHARSELNRLGLPSRRGGAWSTLPGCAASCWRP